ncbi:MAG: hypothetical protein JWR02_217 [Mucilaginibacter sp.]|nr:hypothetical protein [Mucilaginibacter sp.]
MGYQDYSIGGSGSIVNFINTNFQGLDLLTWLTAIDNLLKGMTNKKLYKIIGFDDRAPFKLIIEYYSEDSGDKVNGLAFGRTITKNKDLKTAVHDFFRIPLFHRMKGHGKTMLAYGLKQYLNIGVDVIKVHASLADGGFVWARAHFQAVNKSEMQLILADAKLNLSNKQFKPVKSVFDNYYSKTPNGKAFPINKWSNLDGMEKILRGSDWHGEIDLNKKELLTKFKNYVIRRQ